MGQYQTAVWNVEVKVGQELAGLRKFNDGQVNYFDMQGVPKDLCAV